MDDEKQANILLEVLEHQRNEATNKLAHMHVRVMLLTNELQQLTNTKNSEKEESEIKMVGDK